MANKRETQGNKGKFSDANRSLQRGSGDGLELIKSILDDNPALKERVLQAVEKSRESKTLQIKTSLKK